VKTSPQRLRGEGDNRLVRAPAPGAAERVWIFAVQRDERGRGSAGIANARIDATRAAGASLTWDASALPTLVQWQIANVAGHYAVGLEPSTALHENQTGPIRFPMLEPSESRRLGVTIELLEGATGANLLDRRSHEARLQYLVDAEPHL
jgi:hypothetical protein